MKGRSLLFIVGMVVAITQPVLADYASIAHNLFDGTADTSYDAGTGVFTISQSGNNNLSLNDPNKLLGTVTNTNVSIQTNFHHTSGSEIWFTGGQIDLTFNYDGSPYYMRGPIDGLVLGVEFIPGANLTRISGQGLYTATEDLPGSGNWLATGFSSIKTMTLEFSGVDYSGWDGSESFSGPAETQYTLYPNDSAVPEPVTIILLAVGLLGMVHRRR